jgi:hypothetical protein
MGRNSTGSAGYQLLDADERDADDKGRNVAYGEYLACESGSALIRAHDWSNSP